MDSDQAKQRIDLALRAIAGWESVGMSGRDADRIRMLMEEIRILDGIVARHPALAPVAVPVIDRYRMMLDKVKLGVA